MRRPSYIQRQRHRWEDIQGQTRADYPWAYPQAPRPQRRVLPSPLGAEDTVGSPRDITINTSDLQAAAIKAPGIFSFQSSATVTDMKSFARALMSDRDLLRKAWPATEHCMTLAAFDKLVTPVETLANAVISMNNELATQGINVLIRGDFYSNASDLASDASGQYGIGSLLYLRNKWKARASADGDDPEVVRVCAWAKEGKEAYGGIREKILYTLGRIAMTIEATAFLQDIKPWFANNRVFDMVFEVLLGIGSFALAFATKAYEFTDIAIDTVEDLFKATAKMASLLRKLMDNALWIGAGVLAYYLLVKPKMKKPKMKGASNA